MKTTFRIFFGLLLSLVVLSAAGEDQEKPDADITFTQAELDQMLAPVALYPDTVLSHLLIAATYPLEVVQAERWASTHTDLSGAEALKSVEDEDWDPSVKALVPFPNVLNQMSENLSWTQSLGEAFLQDEERVLDTVQKLRQKAYKEGSLDTMDHVEVNRDGDNIIIEPRVREVVYVPYYDTRVVYGPWWWDDYPPVYWPYRGYHYSSGVFVWGPRVYIGTGIYFSSFHWHRRHVVVVDHHHHHRFRSSRHVAHYHGAHRWQHNPVHRRGVIYRSARARERYGDHHRYSGNAGSGNRGVISRSLSERERHQIHRSTPGNNVETHQRRESVLRNLRDRTATPDRSVMRDNRPAVRNRSPEASVRAGTDKHRTPDNNRSTATTSRPSSGAVGEALRRREAREAAGVRSERQIVPEKREYRAPEQDSSGVARNGGVARDAIQERRQIQGVDRSSSRKPESSNRYNRPERSMRAMERSTRSRESGSHRSRAGSSSRSARER